MYTSDQATLLSLVPLCCGVLNQPIELAEGWEQMLLSI